jgi:multidrug efflux pump subunit AcrA (membrane-fusion protein)
MIAPEQRNGESGTTAVAEHDPAPLGGLEPLQYEALYHEDDVPLADVRENALRVLVYAGAVVVVLLGVLGTVVEIPRELTVPCLLESNESEYLYRFFKPVYLEERFVAVGDTVAAGAPLVRINSPEIVDLIARYDEAARKKRIFDEAERAVFESQIDAMALEETQRDEQLADTRNRLERAGNIHAQELLQRQTVAAQARDEYGRQRALFEKQLGAASQLQAAETARVEAETSLERLVQAHGRDLATLQFQANTAEIEKAILRKRGEEKRNELRTQEATLASEYVKARDALYRTYGAITIDGGSLVLHAPYAGRVAVLAHDGRQVPEEVIVVGVVADEAPVDVHATIPASSIGLVRKGDRVVVKVDTYPHYEWGVIEGRISSLSLSPDGHGHYPVEVTLDPHNRLTPMLRIGMSGQLSVIVEQKSVFSYLFHGLKKGYHEVVKG